MYWHARLNHLQDNDFHKQDKKAEEDAAASMPIYFSPSKEESLLGLKVQILHKLLQLISKYWNNWRKMWMEFCTLHITVLTTAGTSAAAVPGQSCFHTQLPGNGIHYYTFMVSTCCSQFPLTPNLTTVFSTCIDFKIHTKDSCMSPSEA